LAVSFIIYLTWTILNIGLFLFFVFICFKATKLIREKLGLFASIVFLLGLLSFVGDTNNQKLGENFNFQFDKEKDQDYYDKRIASATLDNNLIFSVHLSIIYKKAGDSLITPTSANSSMSGLVAGHRWKVQNITTSTEGKAINYVVNDLVEWKLLGWNIYTQRKVYKGFIDS